MKKKTWEVFEYNLIINFFNIINSRVTILGSAGPMNGFPVLGVILGDNSEHTKWVLVRDINCFKSTTSFV